MADAIDYQFARIDSKEEIIVYLSRLSVSMSLKELADVLHMPMLQIILSLNREHNKEFERAMYRMVRERMYHPESPGPPLVDMLEDGDPALKLRTEKLVELYYAYSAYDEGESGDATFWNLPGLDLYLPRSAHVDGQLKMLYARGTKHDRIFVVERLESVVAGIAPLRTAVARLEAAIDARMQKLAEPNAYGQLAGGVSMLRATLDLQRRHWEAEQRGGRITDEELETHEGRLGEVAGAIEELEDAAWRKFDADHIALERQTADAVLDLLDAKRTARGSLGVQVAIEMAFERPREIVRAEVDAIIALTMRACNALARSERAPRFTREHVIDMLDEEGRSLEPTAAALLEASKSQIGADTASQWEQVMTTLRSGVEGEPAKPSALRSVQRGIRIYRLGLSATSAILEQGVVAQVMTYLARGYAKGEAAASPMRAAGRGFAMLLLRGLANSAVQHRAVKGELFVVGGPRLTAILSTLNEIDAAAARRADFLRDGVEVIASQGFWANQGNRLKALQVRPVPRTPLGASARVVVSGAAFALAIAPLFGDRKLGDLRGDEWSAMVSASLNLGEHVGRALEFSTKGAPPKLSWKVLGGNDDLARFDRSMKLLSSLAAGVGLVANAYRVVGAAEKGDYGQMLIEAAGGAGNFGVAFGQALMGPCQRLWTVGSVGSLNALRLGALLNAAGVAVGIAAFIAQVVYEEWIDVGCGSVLRSTLRSIEQMPCAGDLEDQVTHVREAISRIGDSLCPLRKANGKIRYYGDATDGAWNGVPTYWKAAKLGFSQSAVEKLFDADAADVGPVLVAFYALNAAREGGSE